MEQTGHIHIISAGERVGTTYPAIFRALPTITKTFVFADSSAYEGSSVPATDTERAAIRQAVVSVREISETLGIPFSRETIFSPVFPSARAAVMRIHRDNPGARYTFDLSGGPKDLCMALFALAPWLGAEVYLPQEKKEPQRVPRPGRDIRAMLANVNYQTILAVLLRNRPVPLPSPGLPFIPRQYLFSQVWPYYVRQRVRKPEPGKPVPQYRRGRKPAHDLSQATFSSFMVKLRDSGLVEEAKDTKNRKEKAYRISREGETAFRFFADPATNSLVKMMLDGP